MNTKSYYYLRHCQGRFHVGRGRTDRNNPAYALRVGVFANFDIYRRVDDVGCPDKALELDAGYHDDDDQPREGTYAAELVEHPEARDRAQGVVNANSRSPVLSRVEEHLAAKAKDETRRLKGLRTRLVSTSSSRT